MNLKDFLMFSLYEKRLPSRQYRYLRCVQTQDACVGLAMIKTAAESLSTAELRLTVDNALEGGFAPGGPCNFGDCNWYYTTETFGSCQNQSQSLSAGAIAGISIACVVFVAAVIATVLYQRKKKPVVDSDV